MHSLGHCKMITIIRIYDGTFSGIDWLVYLTMQCWIFRALATIRISQSHFWLFWRSSLYPFIFVLAFSTALVLSGWWWKILTWSQKLSWCWDGCACGCEFMGNSNKDISSQQRTPHPLSQTFSLWYFWMRWEYWAFSPVNCRRVIRFIMCMQANTSPGVSCFGANVEKRRDWGRWVSIRYSMIQFTQ